MRKIIITESQYKRIFEQSVLNPDMSEYRQWMGEVKGKKRVTMNSFDWLIRNKGNKDIERYEFNVEPLGNPESQFKTHMKSYSGYSPKTYSGYEMGNNVYVFYYLID
jgi:hypothetical protein